MSKALEISRDLVVTMIEENYFAPTNDLSQRVEEILQTFTSVYTTISQMEQMEQDS